MKANAQVLSHATTRSYEQFQYHLVWAGDYNHSALSDASLSQDYIWPASLPPTEALPDGATVVARDVTSQSHRELRTQGLTVENMFYEELLTPKQHEQIVEKITTNFEDSALHLKDKEAWKALKPKAESWLSARQLIQHWDRTMRQCCHAVFD